jgi:hypothetical protein
MNSPPKERAAVLGPPIKELTVQRYHHQDAAQVAHSWQREGERLLEEFRRTRGRRHWEAYVRHVAGVRKRLEERE